MKLHTKYQRHGPCGFREEDFLKIFPMQVYVKHKGPGAGPFWPQGYNLNNLCRGPVDEASYQISTTWALWFQRRRFLKVFPMRVYVKYLESGTGPFLVPGL